MSKASSVVASVMQQCRQRVRSLRPSTENT